MKPVSKTAYYCCAVRALDATSAHPACGDRFAERFMTPDAWALFDPFRDLKGPNASNVARCRIIDDLLRARIQARADTGVVIIGAGFDSRAFRLRGGRWVEVDEPAVLALKEAELPAASSPNPLTRVAVEFEHESLGAALAPFRDLPNPVVVLEGVLPYLAAAEVRVLLQTIRSSFANPTIMCDLTTLLFARRYGGQIGKHLRELGAPYARLEVEPLELLQEGGFRLTARISVVGRAAELGLLRVPRWVLATLLRSLRDGYTIGVFETAAATSA